MTKPESTSGPLVDDGGLSIHLRTNLFLGTREMGKRILQSLIATDGIFIPEFFDRKTETGRSKKEKFDPQNLDPLLESWTTSDPLSMGLIGERRKPLKVVFRVSPSDFMMFDHVSLYVCLDKGGVYDSKRADVFSRYGGIEKLLRVAKTLHSVVGANWGFVQNDFYEHGISDILDQKGNVIGNNPPKVRWALRGLFWANFFGPEYVKMFGKTKLLAAPCHKIDELDDGGILLLLSKSPFDAFAPDYAKRKKALYNYLGEGAFTGGLMPEFRLEGRKKRDARPLIETGGILDDIFS